MTGIKGSGCTISSQYGYISSNKMLSLEWYYYLIRSYKPSGKSLLCPAANRIFPIRLTNELLFRDSNSWYCITLNRNLTFKRSLDKNDNQTQLIWNSLRSIVCTGWWSTYVIRWDAFLTFGPISRTLKNESLTPIQVWPNGIIESISPGITIGMGISFAWKCIHSWGQNVFKTSVVGPFTEPQTLWRRKLLFCQKSKWRSVMSSLQYTTFSLLFYCAFIKTVVPCLFSHASDSWLSTAKLLFGYLCKWISDDFQEPIRWLSITFQVIMALPRFPHAPILLKRECYMICIFV